MPRDYKSHGQRSSSRRNSAASSPGSGINWLPIIALIVAFAAFLVYLQRSAPEPAKTLASTKSTAAAPKAAGKAAAKVKSEPPGPRFDFYTILPEKEVVVPDYEIKTRTREERVGKAKPGKYVMQAGSFREFAEADRLRAKLALMGIESRVEKATVGEVVWNRVKIGPYAQMSSVTAIKKRLKENGIDVMVTESGG